MTVPVPAGAGGVDPNAREIHDDLAAVRCGDFHPYVLRAARRTADRYEAAVAALAAAEQRAADAEAKITALREHTLESNPALRQLHDAAVAYVDAREALAEVRGAPLSTTLGYLIRAGYLVPAEPSVTEVSENFRLIDRVKAAEQRADILAAANAAAMERAEKLANDSEEAVLRWAGRYIRAALSSRPVQPESEQ